MGKAFHGLPGSVSIGIRLGRNEWLDPAALPPSRDSFRFNLSPGAFQDSVRIPRCVFAVVPPNSFAGNRSARSSVKYQAFAQTLPLLDGVELEGSAPPGVFVGRFGYPKVSIGPLVSPLHRGHPAVRHARGLGRSLGPGSGRISHRLGSGNSSDPGDRCRETDTPACRPADVGHFSRSVEVEARFSRPPRGHIGLSDTLPPVRPFLLRSSAFGWTLGGWISIWNASLRIRMRMPGSPSVNCMAVECE